MFTGLVCFVGLAGIFTYVFSSGSPPKSGKDAIIEQIRSKGVDLSVHYVNNGYRVEVSHTNKNETYHMSFAGSDLLSLLEDALKNVLQYLETIFKINY